MSDKSITDVVTIIVKELTGFSSEERQRAVQASLTILGENSIATARTSLDGREEAGESFDVPARAKTWIRQNDLSDDQLLQIFHFDGGNVEVITHSIPGKNNREKVRNAYVLLGITQLLSSGEPKFDDKAARALCERQGFYDHTNHVKYLKGGNEFTGSKDKGWALTSPGLRCGAMLVVSCAKVGS